MKYFAIILFLFCNTVFALEQNGAQVIRVIDRNNELLAGAKVTFTGCEKVFYTNIKGECYIPNQLFRQFRNVSIQCISYKTLNLQVKDLSSKVVLESR